MYIAGKHSKTQESYLHAYMHVFENSLYINTMRLERERLHLFLERVCTKKEKKDVDYDTRHEL